MLARAGFVRAALICGRRFLYSNVKPNSKLLIKCDTPLEVSCLPPCEADRNSVILPDSPTFHVEEGWKITQNSATMPLPYKISSIQIPAYREVDIVQNGAHPISLAKYEGPRVLIDSQGSVSYEKLKVSNFTVKSLGDVTGIGYLEGNLDLATSGVRNAQSFKADNITSRLINVTFGGTDLAVHSAYCETMNLKWVVPQEPPDGVTPAVLPLLNMYFGSLRGNAAIEVAGKANFNIGSFEGTLYLRQRYGNVAVHIGGPCQLLEIDVAEGDIELSLPVSTVGSKLSGCVELQASQIEIDRDTLPIDCLDNREFGEVAEAQTFSADFNKPDVDSETLWRARTLRGRIKLTGSSWAEAMTRCIERTTVNVTK